ncbi:hypothetical protein GPECTOR_25g369 [Gonium pectorale]|uniref:Serine aminopeptidase S33 domain-containing protein n=1 Tax=Gonium pectorale TaxID=33097 RepID=A0A150GGN5_GONPE|nr:hypothetical protein GPECTOR_25g369 [Gonium pectorale]|eukprot:KXZ48785.1 hypothetical protein GPECTOR_25g369 [Gonium pectorale]
MDAMRANFEQLEIATGASSTAVIVNAQGLKLFVRAWSPDGGRPVRGVLVMVHGMTMYGGPFSCLARELAAQGMAVVAADLQGHGLSDCYEALRGYVRRFSDYVDDTVQVMDWAAARHPGAPLFLLGESMGGTVVLQTLRRGSVAERVRGAVLLAPAVRVSPAVLPPRAILPILRGLAAIFPRAEVPDDKVVAPENWKGAFGDQAFAEAAYADPLMTLVRPRLKMVTHLAVWEGLWAHLEDITTPLLVAHAPEDTRTEYAYSKALIARAASTDKELLTVPGGRHMLLLDRPEITSRVVGHLTEWLLSRC